MNLQDYVLAFTERSACRCGKCIDAGDEKVSGHTANMFMFDVALKGEPKADEFLAAIAEHHGVFCEVNPLDGIEHNYIELGGWIGDQGLAMQFMGLGVLLCGWRLLTPLTMLGGLISDEMAATLAGRGMVAIQVPASASAQV